MVVAKDKGCFQVSSDARPFLHQHKRFGELISQIARSLKIYPYLVEKDYWLMHSLWALQQQGWHFERKGGTSLSKGHGIITRFSEDIDIRFEPPAELNCEFRSKLDTHSTANWTAIPEQTGH